MESQGFVEVSVEMLNLSAIFNPLLFYYFLNVIIGHF